MNNEKATFERDLDFIIGYLDQSQKMNYLPENTNEIILFLAQEIKKIDARLCAIEERKKK